jgi:hypothetical protein
MYLKPLDHHSRASAKRARFRKYFHYSNCQRMIYDIFLQNSNAKQLLLLPNGAKLFAITIFRELLNCWTIRLQDMDSNDLTDEVSLLYNPRLFWYPDFVKTYGYFSVDQTVDHLKGPLDALSILNNGIILKWNSQPDMLI